MSRLQFIRFIFVLSLPLQSVMAGDEDMLSPYAQFDPETGFYLTPDDLADENNVAEEVPAVGQVADIPDPQIQQLETESGKEIMDSKMIIFGFLGFLIVVAAGIFKISKTTN